MLTNGNTTGGTDIAVSAADITFTDTSKAIFGAGNDLKIYHDGSNSYIQDTSGTGDLRVDTNTFRLRSSNGGETMIRAFEDGAVILSHNNLDRLTTTNTGISVTGNADISSEVQVGGAGSKFAENNLRFNSAGAAYIDHAITSQDINFRVSNSSSLDTTAMIIKSDGDVEFKDDVEIDGNLTVDGNIIHGSGGGIFNGDQAITSGASALAFTLTRASTGTLVFDVWLTAETTSAASVAKKYTVAHSFNSTPVYNKIIDTGPDNSNDFTVVFANSNTGATGTSVTCSIQSVTLASQNIGYTVQVGHDSTRALTFTAAS